MQDPYRIPLIGQNRPDMKHPNAAGQFIHFPPDKYIPKGKYAVAYPTSFNRKIAQLAQAARDKAPTDAATLCLTDYPPDKYKTLMRAALLLLSPVCRMSNTATG